jgi:mechanosensitive ion channel-like protein
VNALYLFWEVFMQYQLDVFLTSLNQFWLQLVNFVPKLLAVIVILFLGWLAAKLVRTGIKRILELIQFDNFAQKSGLEAFISSGSKNVTLSGIISQVMYWLVIIMFVITGANTLGLTEVADLLKDLAAYLPRIILAILVMIFGTLLARFINRLVFAWLHSIKFERALVVSTSAEYGIQILALFVALEQLGIGVQLIHSLFVIVFGAIFLALALAFGLGGRDWAAKVIEDLSKKPTKKQD